MIERRYTLTDRVTRLSGAARAVDPDTARGIRGTAIVYGAETVIMGSFRERVDAGAVDHLLDTDVVALLNHNVDYPIARTTAGTLELRSTTRGLEYTIDDVPDYRADVLGAVRRGDIQGNSFSFSMDEDAVEEWHGAGKRGELPLRVIKRVGRLFDVSPVVMPAYPQTSVTAI